MLSNKSNFKLGSFNHEFKFLDQKYWKKTKTTYKTPATLLQPNITNVGTLPMHIKIGAQNVGFAYIYLFTRKWIDKSKTSASCSIHRIRHWSFKKCIADLALDCAQL